jgi:hypothetical protein
MSCWPWRTAASGVRCWATHLRHWMTRVPAPRLAAALLRAHHLWGSARAERRGRTNARQASRAIYPLMRPLLMSWVAHVTASAAQPLRPRHGVVKIWTMTACLKTALRHRVRSLTTLLALKSSFTPLPSCCCRCALGAAPSLSLACDGCPAVINCGTACLPHVSVLAAHCGPHAEEIKDALGSTCRLSKLFARRQ